MVYISARSILPLPLALVRSTVDELRVHGFAGRFLNFFAFLGSAFCWGCMLSHVKPLSLGLLLGSLGTPDSSMHGMSLLKSFLNLFTSSVHS